MADANGNVIIGSIFSLGNDEPFHFYKTEVPSELANGLENVLAVHRFSGGLRTIDSYGGHPEPLTWHGVLFSVNDIPAAGNRPAIPAQFASNRSETLRKLSEVRTPVQLRFQDYTWTGIIRSYKPVIHSINKVSYTLTFEVLTEDLRPATDFFALTTFSVTTNLFADMFAQFLDFMKNATKMLKLLAALARLTMLLIQAWKKDPSSLLLKGISMVPGGNDFLDFVQAATNFVDAFSELKDELLPQFAVDMENGKPHNTLEPDAFTKVYGPQAQKLQNRLEQIQVYLTNYAVVATEPKPPVSNLGAYNAAREALIKQATNNGALPMVKGPAATATATTNVQNALNNIKLLQKTFTKIVTPKIARKVTIQNPDLYVLSAKYYGDLQHWKIIAKANALHAPVPPPGLYTLIIPDANIVTDDYNMRAEV
jgi:hypothetical protein